MENTLWPIPKLTIPDARCMAYNYILIFTYIYPLNYPIRRYIDSLGILLKNFVPSPNIFKNRRCVTGRVPWKVLWDRQMRPSKKVNANLTFVALPITPVDRKAVLFFSAYCLGALINGCWNGSPKRWEKGGIVHPPIGRKNTTYIRLIVLAEPGGVKNATYHLLGEPEKSIDNIYNPTGPYL